MNRPASRLRTSLARALESGALVAVSLLLCPPARSATGTPTQPTLETALPADTKLRCGWFDNPSPGNASLTDRDGEWTVAQQGSHIAKGTWPRFKPEQWVRTGTGSAGHGCACLSVQAQADDQLITVILKARSLPLSNCRRDRHLTEPPNPIN